MEDIEVVDKVIKINRCAKVVKGGRRFSFNALVVVGDQKGNVGYALGKAKEVPDAVKKGIEKAKQNMFRIPLVDGTIPHSIMGKYESTKVFLKPAKPGTGNIAGGAVRAILEVGGITDIYTKCYGSTTPHNSLKATVNALKRLISPKDMMIKRGVIIPRYEKYLTPREKAIIKGELDESIETSAETIEDEVKVEEVISEEKKRTKRGDKKK